MNKIQNILFRLILFYSASIGFIITLRHTYILLFFQIKIFEILLALFFILVGVALLFSIIQLIRSGFQKRYFLILCIFWLSQVFYFGILGYVYINLYGPVVAFFINLTKGFDYGLVTKIWLQDFIFKLNSASDSVYFGINFISLFIVIFLYKIWRNIIPASR